MLEDRIVLIGAIKWDDGNSRFDISNNISTTGTIISTGLQFGANKYFNGGTWYTNFDGEFDDLAVVDYPPSAAEVKHIYSSQSRSHP